MLWSIRSTVAFPMPREEPVTRAVLVIIYLSFLHQESRQPNIYWCCYLEVLVTSVDELYVAARFSHQRRVLGEDKLVRLRKFVRVLKIRIEELMRKLDVPESDQVEGSR